MGTEAPSVTNVIERFEKMLIGWQQMVEFKPEVANHGIAECTIVLAALKAYRPDAEPVAWIVRPAPREGVPQHFIRCLTIHKETMESMVADGDIAEPLYAAPSADGWVAVGPGTMPPEGAEILVTGWVHNKPNTERFRVVVRYTAEGFFYNEESDNEIHPPTHWQPLPAPPTGAAS